MNVLLHVVLHDSGNRRNLYLIPVANGDASGACFTVKKMAGSCFKLNMLPHVRKHSSIPGLLKYF